jgi:hypothetical protein
MFELLAGKHPLWQRNEDKDSYKAKVLNFKQLAFSKRFSPMARNLLEKLCHTKPSMRYSIE